jgi:hypothetical protein
MFVPDADMACLRQGDILCNIPFPLISFSELQILGTFSGESVFTATPRTHRNDSRWLTGQVPVRMCSCAVISQCCDLEPRHNKIRMPTFVVARLQAIPESIRNNEAQLNSLRANKDPRTPGDPGFINLFHIEPHERLDGQEWVVDFNQMVSIPSAEFPAILNKKTLQMNAACRVKFKIKLAASLARLTDEERSMGLENPWA